MAEQKRTKWFPSKVNPDRVGVYERKWPHGGVGYSQWDGRAWGWMASSAALAAGATFPSFSQMLKWRGLAKEPK